MVMPLSCASAGARVLSLHCCCCWWRWCVLKAMHCLDDDFGYCRHYHYHYRHLFRKKCCCCETVHRVVWGEVCTSCVLQCLVVRHCAHHWPGHCSRHTHAHTLPLCVGVNIFHCAFIVLLPLHTCDAFEFCGRVAMVMSMQGILPCHLLFVCVCAIHSATPL